MIKNKNKNEHYHYDENRMGNGSASSSDKEDASSYNTSLQQVKTNGIMNLNIAYLIINIYSVIFLLIIIYNNTNLNV
jgi:hypothetical protein